MMSVYLSSIVSAPAYQTCFSSNPSKYFNLSLHPQDPFKMLSMKLDGPEEPIRFVTHSNSNSNPSSPLSSSSITNRARAMGNLTEAMARRKAKENMETISSSHHLLKPTSTTMKTKRDEKKALGLRAAVGSYKMRCSGTQSLSASPVTSEPFVLPIKPTQTSSSSIQSKALETVTNMSWVDSPESRLQHSQYLAARRESIIGRVGGGHRRVVSEHTSSKPNSMVTKALNHHTLRPSTPLMTTLPSLDQISSWVALRKHHVNDPMEEDLVGLSTPTWSAYSMESNRTLLNVKSKSLPIFSHARDPSIPRICLSPDSDDEDEGHDPSDETQSEPPTSAIPMMLNDASGLQSTHPSLDRSLDFKCTLMTSSTPPSTSTSLDHRAAQRQALLTNLALARRRRTTNVHSTPHFVAPV